MFCLKCGKKLENDDKFCGNCGNPVAREALNTNKTSPSSLTENQWYYSINGDRNGPFKRENIEELIKQGAIKSDTLLWNGTGDWKNAISTEINYLFQNNPQLTSDREIKSFNNLSTIENKDTIPGIVFSKCPNCKKNDIYLQCVNCNKSDKFIIKDNGAQCDCGQIMSMLNCPYCNTEIRKENFFIDKDKEIDIHKNLNQQENNEGIKNVFRVLGLFVIVGLGIWYFNYLFTGTNIASQKPEIVIEGYGAKNVDFYDLKIKFGNLTGKMRYKGGLIGKIQYTCYGSDNVKLWEGTVSHTSLDKGESCAFELVTSTGDEIVKKIVFNVPTY